MRLHVKVKPNSKKDEVVKEEGANRFKALETGVQEEIIQKKQGL